MFLWRAARTAYCRSCYPIKPCHGLSLKTNTPFSNKMYHPSGHHHHRSHPSSSARHPTDRESEQLPRLRDVLPGQYFSLLAYGMSHISPTEHFDSYRSHRGAYNFDNMNDALPSHSNSARLPPIHDSHSPPYRYQEATPRYHRDSSPPYSQPRGREIFNATHNPSSPTARNGAFHVLVPHQGIESGLVSISQSRHAARVNPAEASTSSSSSKKRFECHVCGRWMDRQSVYNVCSKF